MQIYFDNAATTCVAAPVADAVRAAMTETYGNPSSMHQLGVDAERLVRESTETLAALLRADKKEIYYTSGGTESDNWALFGAAEAAKRRGRHIVISSVEHPAVSAPASALEEAGWDVTRLPVDEAGRVDPQAAAAAVREDTALVSVMMVNNEVGTIEPVAEIGAAIRRANPDVLFHVDAIQAFGKMSVRPRELQADLVSISGHKLHGPKGVGLLYVRSGARIRPLIHGGGQQGGMRSGTDNVPGIVGLAEAARISCAASQEAGEHMRALKARLADGLAGIGDVRINGPDPRSEGSAPHILNASFTGVRSEVLLHALEERGIYVSAGSACSSHKRAGSPTLTAIGCTKEEMESALRFSFCAENTEEEVDHAIAVLDELVPALRMFKRR